MSDSADNLNGAVPCLASRLIGDFHSKGADDLDCLRYFLTYFEGDGTLPNGPTPFMGGVVVLRRVLGRTREELNTDWERICHEPDNTFPTLDLRVIEAFFPVRLQKLIALFISLGPAAAAARSGRGLYAYSQKEVRPTRARPEGGRIAKRSVVTMHGACRRLMRLISELNALDYPCSALRPWRAVPALKAPRMPLVETDRSGPAERLLRTTLHGLERELQHRLKWSDGSELDAVNALSIGQLTRSGVWRFSRYRTAMALLVAIGGRIGALVDLRESDYDPCHEFPDGTVGPAIALKPGKSIHSAQIRWKGLTSKEQAIIEVHLRIQERLYCERVSTHRPDCWRVLQTPRPLPDERYLLATFMWEPHRPPCAEAITNRLVGSADGKVKPLLPRPAQQDSVSYGYSSHAVRHTTQQLVRAAANTWLSDNNIRHISGQAISDAVHDEEITGDAYGYQDLKSERGRELWARVGIQLASERIWTDVGAERIPDVAAFERAMRRQIALEDAAARSAKRVADVEHEVGFKGEAAGNQDVVALLAAMSEDRRTRAALEEARNTCEALRTDRRTWIIVPDDAQRQGQPSLAEVERHLRNGTLKRQVNAVTRVRPWITVTELARLCGISSATARRWACSRGGPRPARDLRVDLTSGPRRRRIVASSLDPGELTEGQRDMLAELLSRWPSEENWSVADCTAPLAVPSRSKGVQRAAED